MEQTYEEILEQNNKLVNDNKFLIDINDKITEISKTTSELNIKLMSENSVLRETLKHGVFIEYDNDKNTTKFVPILGKLDFFLKRKDNPSKIMYSFTPKILKQWLDTLRIIMEKSPGQSIEIDPKDLT